VVEKMSRYPSDIQAKSHPHRGAWEGGVDGTPPLGFCCVSILRRDFAFGRKPLMCSTR